MVSWLALSPSPALLSPAQAQSESAATTTPSATPATPSVSTIGMLPIHGVSVDLDALPTPGKDKDKPKNNDEMIAALQSLWDSYLKGAGFNVISFTADVNDLGERGAGRLARLCTWAKQNNVRIAPTLIGAPEGKPLPTDYPNKAASFVGKVIATLGAEGAPSYAQIMLYQLERPLNHPASHGPMEASAAAATLKATAEAVRAAEQAGLAQAGIQASPLLVRASFDYELIKRGAIVNTPMSDDTYGEAYAALRDYLVAVFGSAPVEAVAIEWFPGSLTSEGVSRMPDLMLKLQADLPGKLLVMNTGYSSAAGSDTSQAKFYALAFNNLVDLRARQGVESPFTGILWRNALDSGAGTVKRMTPEEIANEDWSQRAAELNRMWTDPKADAKDTRNWLATVQSGFGMLSRANESSQGLAPKTAYLVMSRLETALATSPEAADAVAMVKELVAPGSGGKGQLKSRLQGAMLSMLDVFLSKTAENLFTPKEEASPFPATPNQPLPVPDVQITELGTLPASVVVNANVTIPVTLFNAGSATARDAAVYLREKQVDLAHSNPTLLLPGASTTVQLSFTASKPGEMTGIAVEAFCANDADPASNHAELGNLHVEQKSGPPKPPRHFDDVVIHTGGVFTASDITTGNGGGGKTSTTSDPGSIQIVDMGPPRNGGFGSVFGSSMTSTGGSPDAGAGGGVVMMGQTSGSGGTAGAGTTAGGTPRSAPAPSAPAPVVTPPINMTLTNPFSTAFQYAVATLFVEGQKIASRSLGTVLPGTNRTVSFTEWKAAKAGTYKIRVDLEGMAGWGKKLKSSAASEVTVGSAPAPAPVAVRPLTPGPATPASPATTTGMGQPRPVFATRDLTPYVRPASSGLVPMPRGGIRGGMGGVRGLGLTAPFGLTANSILVRPFPATVGAPLDVSVQLANRDGTPAGNVSVQVSVDGEDLGSVSVALPATGSAIASGFRSWTAKSGRHDFRAVVTAGDKSGEATKAVLVNAAGAGPFAGRPLGGVTAGTMTAGGMKPGGMSSGGMSSGGMSTGGMSTGGMATGTMTPSRPGGMTPFGGRPAPGMSVAPDLQVTTTDIKIAPPAPAQGTAAVINVTVRNLGAALATDGKVLLVLHADGKEIERKQFPAAVAARGMLALQWPITAPAGALSVSATATATGDGNPNNNTARSGVTTPKTMTTPIKIAPTTTTMSR
jgi:hypothetical protein